MPYETIQYEVVQGVARLTLNRPAVMNAINQQLGQALYDAFKAIEGNSEVRAVVLTGAGRGFCAGQDLGDDSAINNGANLSNAVRERYNLLIAKMQSLPMPIIAAVNGAAAGAGFALALACDIRFAAVNAKFTMAFSKIGLVPDSGSSYFLPRLVGVGRALEMAWMADVFSAEEALRYGVVNRVFSADLLLEETYAFAERLAKGPTLALGLTKQAINRNFSSSLADALELEAELQAKAGASDDFQEGVQAYLEKRPPVYKGR